MPELEDGFYWVRADSDEEWTVGRYERVHGRWWVVGWYQPEPVTEVGPRIEPPSPTLEPAHV